MSEFSILNYEEVSYGNKEKEYTVAARLNLREEPSLEAKVVRILEKGEKIKGVNNGEWTIVEDGYCMSKFLV